METSSEYDGPSDNQPLIERWQEDLVRYRELQEVTASKLGRYLLIQSGQLHLDFEGTTR